MLENMIHPKSKDGSCLFCCYEVDHLKQAVGIRA
jgi:hypothetical protein